MGRSLSGVFIQVAAGRELEDHVADFVVDPTPLLLEGPGLGPVVPLKEQRNLAASH